MKSKYPNNPRNKIKKMDEEIELIGENKIDFILTTGVYFF
jgi:hypothetical protein